MCPQRHLDSPSKTSSVESRKHWRQVLEVEARHLCLFPPPHLQDSIHSFKLRITASNSQFGTRNRSFRESGVILLTEAHSLVAATHESLDNCSMKLEEDSAKTWGASDRFVDEVTMFKPCLDR